MSVFLYILLLFTAGFAGSATGAPLWALISRSPSLKAYIDNSIQPFLIACALTLVLAFLIKDQMQTSTIFLSGAASFVAFSLFWYIMNKSAEGIKQEWLTRETPTDEIMRRGRTPSTPRYENLAWTVVDLCKTKEPSDISDLCEPFLLPNIHDGSAYSISSPYFSEPNLFTSLARLGDLIVKVPSDRGRSDFAKYVRLGLTDPEDIRPLEKEERFENLNEALELFPEFNVTRNAYGDNFAHFLVVHRIQHARLESSCLIGLPQVRFIVLKWRHHPAGVNAAPAVVQEIIDGIRLFDMVEPFSGKFRSGYRYLKPQIKDQIYALVNSGISIHIDWNIQNFIWQETTARLYYVDSKPTLLAQRSSVLHNLASLRRTFL